jgi:polysaccharide biosynthesis transport protein
MYQLTSGEPAKPHHLPVNEFEWSRLWRGLVRRKQVFMVTSGVALAAILGYTYLTPPQYTTHVKLIAGSSGAQQQQNGPTTLPVLNALLAASGVQSAETYAELFKENAVAANVIQTQGLKMTPEALLSRVSVIPVVNTSLLDLAVKWPDAAGSARIANAFAASFVERERSLVAGQADSAITSLTAQIPDAQRAAAVAHANLTQFQSQNNLADVQAQTQALISTVSGLEAKINATELERQQEQATLANINDQLAKTPQTTSNGSSTAPNPVLANLETQLAQANLQLELAQKQYTDQHPTVIALKQQVEQLRLQIASTPATVTSAANTTANPVYNQLKQQAATAQATIAADQAELAQLASQQGTYATRVGVLPEKASKLLDLQRSAKLAQDVLDALQQKLNDANITKATALSDVTITQSADPAAASVSPIRWLNTIVGIFASIILGVVVSLILVAFDRRIHDEQQIEEDLNLPVLASVPQLGSLRSALPSGTPSLPAHGHANALPGQEEDWLRGYAIESFLQLVTSLRYSASSDRPLRCITITSPAQGDGKSTIALNTAIAMAAIEPRVLLIDGDLRRPSLHSKLNREVGCGLSDVLVGTASIDEAITKTEHDGLDLMTSGTRSPNSVKLLQSTRFDETLQTLLATYRTIIIDAPALGPVIDAAILAAKSDGTLMVVSIDQSDANVVNKAIAKLKSVGVHNLIGTVANRTKPTKREGYDDYFYTDGPSKPPALK